MAITIETAPPALAHTRNPIPLVLSSDELVATAEVLPYLDLAFTTTSPVADQGINWSLTDPETGLVVVLILTAKASPDGTGTQIPVNPGDPVDDYLDAVLAKLQLNPLLNTYYTVAITAADATSGTIRFTAKVGGGVNFASLANSLAGTTPTVSGTSTAKVYTTAFKLWCYLFVEETFGSAQWTRVPIDVYRNEDDEFEADLAPFLDAFAGGVASVPAHDLAAPSFFLSTAVLRYYLTLAEMYQGGGDDAPEFKLQTVSYTTYRCLAGGLNALEWPANTDFISALSTSKRLLTWWPDEKELADDQPEFISWLNNTGADQQVGLVVNVRFSDGTNADTTPIPADTNHIVPQGRLVHVPVGYDALDLGSVSALKTVTDWTVQLENDGGTKLSVQRTYFRDTYPRLQTRYLLWVNSLGGLDTLRLTGERTVRRAVTKEAFSRFLPPDYTALAGRDDAVTVEDTHLAQVASGTMPAGERRAAQDVFAARHVYLVQDGRMEKVVIEGGTVDVDRDNEDLATLEISYRPTFPAGPTTPAQLTP